MTELTKEQKIKAINQIIKHLKRIRGNYFICNAAVEIRLIENRGITSWIVFKEIFPELYEKLCEARKIYCKEYECLYEYGTTCFDNDNLKDRLIMLEGILKELKSK